MSKTFDDVFNYDLELTKYDNNNIFIDINIKYGFVKFKINFSFNITDEFKNDVKDILYGDSLIDSYDSLGDYDQEFGISRKDNIVEFYNYQG